jgi:hypothetical protein
VVHDRVKADLGQRMAQLGPGMVERPALVREIGSEIDDWDRVSVGHDFSGHPYFNGFEARIAPLHASNNGKSGSVQPQGIEAAPISSHHG